MLGRRSLATRNFPSLPEISSVFLSLSKAHAVRPPLQVPHYPLLILLMLEFGALSNVSGVFPRRLKGLCHGKFYFLGYKCTGIEI